MSMWKVNIKTENDDDVSIFINADCIEKAVEKAERFFPKSTVIGAVYEKDGVVRDE